MHSAHEAGEPLLTVAEALAHPCMAGAEVVAGGRGLQNAVHGVGVLDLSDLDAIRNGQLVISNAYPLVEVDLSTLISDLWSRRATAFGVKLSEYWTAVPDELKASANAHEFPLLVLPEGPFDELVNPLLEEIAVRQALTLRKLSELHNALTDAALREDGDPSVVVEILRRVVGREAAIVDHRGELVAGSGSAERWNAALTREAVEAATEGNALVSRNDSSYHVVPITGPDLETSAILIEGGTSADSFAQSAAAQSAVVVGMFLAGRRRIREVHRRFERELLEDVASKRVSPGDARERIKWIGWYPGDSYVVLVAGRRPRPEAGPGNDVSGIVGEQTFRAIEEELARGEPLVRPFLKHPGIGLIVHLPAAEDQELSVRDFGLKLTTLLDRKIPEARMAIGVSDVRNDVTELPDAFQEAALALLLAPREETNPVRPLWFSRLGPLRLLSRVKDKRRLFENARLLLQPLAVGNSGGAQDALLETLATLLSHNMNLRVAADQQYFHYNTIRHRLSRLRELLGDRLTRPHDRLAISMSIAALRYLQVEEELHSFPQDPRRPSGPSVVRKARGN